MPLTREAARYRDVDEENKAKIGGPRTESAFDVRMPETTSAQEVPQRRLGRIVRMLQRNEQGSGVKKPHEAPKAKTFWKMKASRDRGDNF